MYALVQLLKKVTTVCTLSYLLFCLFVLVSRNCSLDKHSVFYKKKTLHKQYHCLHHSCTTDYMITYNIDHI